jgi:triosephosphate isomerase
MMSNSKPLDRGTLVAGNWKMYLPLDKARELAAEIVERLPQRQERRPTVGLFPNAVALSAVAEAARGREAQVLVGAQNAHFEAEGAFTGELSTAMVLSAGGRGVILGHSERRHVFGESDEMIAKKVVTSLRDGLTAILCVGETIEERGGGKTESVVERQLLSGIKEVPTNQLSQLILAYEPVWAIGTGKTATGAQGQEVHRFLRERLAKHLGDAGASDAQEIAAGMQILYGGSVKPGNAAELISEEDIDGFLVGGASLNADSFLEICEAAGV